MLKKMLGILLGLLTLYLIYQNMKFHSLPTSIDLQVKLCRYYIDFDCEIVAISGVALGQAKGTNVAINDSKDFNYCQVLYEKDYDNMLSLTCFKDYQVVAYTARFHSFPLNYTKYSKCATMRIPTQNAKKIGENFFIVGCVRNDIR